MSHIATLEICSVPKGGFIFHKSSAHKKTGGLLKRNKFKM